MAFRQRIALLVGLVVLVGVLAVASLPFTASGTSCGSAVTEWRHPTVTVAPSPTGSTGALAALAHAGGTLPNPCRDGGRSRLVTGLVLGVAVAGLTAAAVVLLRDERRVKVSPSASRSAA